MLYSCNQKAGIWLNQFIILGHVLLSTEKLQLAVWPEILYKQHADFARLFHIFSPKSIYKIFHF